MLTPMNRAGGLPATFRFHSLAGGVTAVPPDDACYGIRESILARSRHRGHSCHFLFRDAGEECPRPAMVPKGGIVNAARNEANMDAPAS
jgi:hypothetical protein